MRSLLSSLGLMLVLSVIAVACGVVDDARDGIGSLVGMESEVPVLESGQTFVDDFDPPDDSWFIGQAGPLRFRAEDGAYMVEGGSEGSPLVSPRAYPADAEVAVSTTFRVLEQPDDRGGILAVGCHLTEGAVGDNGFAAVVQASEGRLYYGLLEWVDDGIEPVVPLDAPAPDFDPDDETILELRCRPSSGSMRLELVVNGDVLATEETELGQPLPEVVRAGLNVDTSPLIDDERLIVRIERFEVDVSGR